MIRHQREIENARAAVDALLADYDAMLRIIYHINIRNNPPTLSYAKWLARLGSQVRTAYQPIMPLVIVDRQVSFVPLSTADAPRSAMEVHSKAIASAFAIAPAVERLHRSGGRT
jgi:hypothetical protein